MPKRPIIPAETLSADSQKLMDVLNDGGDIAAILVATGFIDACLGSILESKLRQGKTSEKLLDPRGGALGNYAARADLCYVLGFVDEAMFQDIKKISEIRNLLAHSHMALDFNSPEIQKLCKELSYVRTLKNGDLDEPISLPGLLDCPRSQFVITSVFISQRLIIKGIEAKGKSESA